MLISSQGIVLKQRKIANNRRMITLFTKNYGKISAGTSLNEKSKSKSALALRPFSYADYDIFKGRDSYSINSAQVNKSYYAIGEDLDRFAVASKLLEYMDKILEDEQARPKLFDMTIEFMECLVKSKGNYDTLLYAFILKTLRVQGILPELNKCVNCGSEIDGKSFSVCDGGALCKKCSETTENSEDKLIYNVNFDIIKTLKYFINNPLEQFETITLKPEISKQVGEVLSEYIDYYLGVDVLRNEIQWR